MRLGPRQFGAMFLFLACAAIGDLSAAAGYPEKPVKIVVPFPPGGSTDALARMVGEDVSVQLRQPVIVENRPGASGNIAASYVAQSDPDGYTIFLGSSPVLAVNLSLYSKLSFDPRKDFAPIVLAALLPNVVVVPASSPVDTMQELAALMKRSRPPVNYASSVAGAPSHLGVEMFKDMTGTQATMIPYKGGMPALTDLVGGQTSFMFAILPEAMPLVEAGKLKALAVTTRQRLPSYPDLPTVAESGTPGYELIAWYGFVAPARTPPAIVSRLNAAFNQALERPEIRRKLEEMSFVVEGGPPGRLRDLMQSEIGKWARVVERAHVKLD